jgi:thioredoxin 2
VIDDALLVVCTRCNAANRVPAARLTEQPRCGRCKAPLFDDQPAELDAAGFAAQSARSDLPVVVDFWAPWCGPCRMMSAAYARAARELAPHYRLVKVNTQEQPQLAARHGIRGIPTLVIFRRGVEVARQSGAMDFAALQRWIRASA